MLLSAQTPPPTRCSLPTFCSCIVVRTLQRAFGTSIAALCLAAAATAQDISPASTGFRMFNASVKHDPLANSGDSIFSWNPETLSTVPTPFRAGAIDSFEKAIRKSISRNPQREAVDFWNPDLRVVGISRFYRAVASISYLGVLGGAVPIDFTSSDFDIGDIAPVGIAFLAGGLLVIGGLQCKRKNQGGTSRSSRSSRAYFYDCGKSGGFLVVPQRMRRVCADPPPTVALR